MCKMPKGFQYTSNQDKREQTEKALEYYWAADVSRIPGRAFYYTEDHDYIAHDGESFSHDHG